MSNRVDQLDQLRHEVNINLAIGAIELDLVTNDEGHCPVVVALDSEPLSTILGRLRAVGGYGTVFSRGVGGDVRVVSMLHDVCAIAPDADSVVPGPDAEFGMFLDFVALHPEGVAIPAAFERPAKAQNAHAVDLTEA